MSLPANLRRRLQPAWGTEGAGLVWLVGGFGSTVVLGLALQLLALRGLSDGDYATFVFGLGIGNVANAVASAMQPVVAVRTGTANPAFLPAAPAPILVVVLLTTSTCIGLLAPGVGLGVAALVCLQVPLHAVAAIGLGRLQAQRAFARIAGLNALWSVARIAVVLPAVVASNGSATVFVLALPAALAVELVVLALLGGFRGTSWRAATDGRVLLRKYGLWALFGWLLNADAIFARLLLDRAAADAYALAVTLGRQPLYAVAPLALVLLPVTQSGRPDEQRHRLGAILLVSILLLAGTLLVIGGWPRTIVAMLTGSADRADPMLIRGYAIVGSLGAAATLLLTFAFAMDRSPRLGALATLAFGSGIAAAVFGHDPHRLLIIQTTVVASLVIGSTYLCLRATAPDAPAPSASG